MTNYTDKGKDDPASLETIVVINCVLNAPLILISITGNSLVLASVFRTPAIRSTSMIMLCSLALSDLLVGVIVQPFYIADELTKGLLVHGLWGVTSFHACGVSLVTMTVISVDRLMALHYHLRYATLVTEFRVKFMVGIIWVVVFLCAVLFIWNKFVQHLIAGTFIGVCLVICTFSYIKIHGIVRRHQSQIQVQQQIVDNSNIGTSVQMVRLKKTTINTFIFYIVLVLCYFPQVVLLTLFGTIFKHWKAEWSLATTIVHLNSSINPILYCWRLRELRAAVVKTAKRLFFQQN